MERAEDRACAHRPERAACEAGVVARPADIVVRSLCKTYAHGARRIEAVRDVSFVVLRGETSCIVGPSGCGKSTLLRLLLGLDEPSGGRVELDSERWAAGTAYVQQAPALLPWRTALQNALLGTEIRGSLNATIVDRVRRELEEYGLGGFEDSLAAELSGGMRQRVELIRALESRPAILFCDEPFSAIDFVTRLELTSRFKRLCKIFGATTVFVTHNIEEAIFLGDEVVVLSGRPGHVVAKYRPILSVHPEDAVRCRESPEFSRLFERIWDDLKAPSAI